MRGVRRRHKRCYRRCRRDQGRWNSGVRGGSTSGWLKARGTGGLQGARVEKAALELATRYLSVMCLRRCLKTAAFLSANGRSQLWASDEPLKRRGTTHHPPAWFVAEIQM